MNRQLYTVLWFLALPFVWLRLLIRSRKQPEYRRRMAERLGYYAEQNRSNQPLIWLHAVSVGELLAALPLLEHLLARGDSQILVTTTTPTGSAQVKKQLADRVLHVYAPYDLPFAVRRLLHVFNPKLLLVMETELWPNTLHLCRKRVIPRILVNGRMSARSAKGYARFAKLSKHMLQDLSLALMQYKADGQRMIELGLPEDRLHICGSVKFDIDLDEQHYQQAIKLRQSWPQQKVWLAASTHPGEDAQILAAHRQVQEQTPAALLVLVPRHPERVEDILALCERLSVVTRSSNSTVTTDTDVLLVDTLGELMNFYGACDVAFVGGSLVPHGGHNLVEPAVWAKPVIAGEHMFNFATMSQEMINADALTVVKDSQALAQTVNAFFQDETLAAEMGAKAAAFAEANRGALKRMLYVLETHLPKNGV